MPHVDQALRQQGGGKAGNLLRLKEAGLLVPDFVVSPEDIGAAIHRLGFPLAVRSSASLEDGERDSFAGQFQSFLNLNSTEGVRAAVTACRDSASAPEVVAYCEQRGIDVRDLRVDVIIQRMIQPTLAGVAFGVNPTTGAEEVIIEACEGLADELLAGTQAALPADHHLVQRYRPMIEDAVRTTQIIFGCPQDIEFAIEDDQLYILQARPITRINFSSEIGEWTNADFRDGGVSAHVCSPLMWSLYQWIWDASLKQTLREIHLFRRDFEASRMFFGRPYWNLGEVKRCLERVPGYVEREFDTDLSVRVAYEDEGHRTQTNLFTIARALPTVFGIDRFFKLQMKAGETLLARRTASLAVPKKTQDTLAACATTQATSTEFRNLIEHDYFEVESTYFRTVFAVSLAKLDFKMAFPECDYGPLVTGLPPLRHMEPQRRILQMKARGEGKLKALVREFRHHCRWGVDVIHPRWDEDMAFVESLFEMTFETSHRDTRTAFENAKADAISQLPRRQRAGFLRKLERLRRFVWLREELRDVSNQMYYLIRRQVLNLADQRFLGEDVFFMTWREIIEDDRRGINARRAVYESYRNFKAPNEIGRSANQASAIGATEWQGIGASGGTVMGVARVAHTVEQAMQVEPGSILICPFTEPGWTPALSRVAAVVTETGGLLSHAAVICREFGLPAVLAFEAATSRIPDGAMIKVDGASGRIERVD